MGMGGWIFLAIAVAIIAWAVAIYNGLVALPTGLEAVIHADRRVALHEFVVLSWCARKISGRRTAAGSQRLIHLREEAILILSMIALSGRNEHPQKAFAGGARQLGLLDAALAPLESMALQSAGQALDRLRELAPLAKEKLVGALFAAATADER